MEPNQTGQSITPGQPFKNSKLQKWLTTVTLFSKLLAIFLFILFPFVGFYLGMQYQKLNQSDITETKNISFNNPTPILIGGNKDKYGCLTGAGYSWCKVKNKCLRVWEEQCIATPSASIAIDTSSWKTYEDKELGISFEYPTELEIDKQPVNSKIEYMNLFINFKPHDYKPDKVAPIELLYVYNPSGLSLDKLQEKLADTPMGEGPGLSDKNDAFITNSSGIIARYSDIHYCVSTCKSYTWYYKNQVFQMIYFPNYGEYNQRYKEYFDKIFSTFKFTN